MIDRIQAIRGMNDILPDEVPKWYKLGKIINACLNQYGYQEIRFPLVESTSLFKRSIGEVTDIVEKEMYTFKDLNGESISLRPEGTASCLRACLEHGLLHNQQQKLWYMGPMFRHEKPQKGRYRQFHQLGVEALGYAGTAIEFELLMICKRLWESLSVQQVVQLEINTLGELHERHQYRDKLVDYLKQHWDLLDEDSKRRLHTNPLRILDSKNEALADLLNHSPKLIDSLNPESRQHFDDFCEGLNQLNIPYRINPRLVRGLDYYGHTVFEWVTDKLGSQSTVCAGGRYDILVEQLGGSPTPAVGFALGIERLLLLLDAVQVQLLPTSKPSFFIISTEAASIVLALSIAETLRNINPNWRVINNTAGGSFKSQFKRADKSGAEFALILGEDEVKNNQISIKPLRSHEEQITISQSELSTYFKNKLG